MVDGLINSHSFFGIEEQNFIEKINCLWTNFVEKILEWSFVPFHERFYVGYGFLTFNELKILLFWSSDNLEDNVSEINFMFTVGRTQNGENCLFFNKLFVIYPWAEIKDSKPFLGIMGHAMSEI